MAVLVCFELAARFARFFRVGDGSPGCLRGAANFKNANTLAGSPRGDMGSQGSSKEETPGWQASRPSPACSARLIHLRCKSVITMFNGYYDFPLRMSFSKITESFSRLA